MRKATPRVRAGHRVGLLCALTILLATGLASCGYSSSSQLVAKGTVPVAVASATATWPDGTWTPYPYNPTETPSLWTVTPYLPTPASTAGWQIYTDSAYHFKTVIPPGWRLATELDTTSAPQCEYDAVYFPPGDTRAMEQRVWVGMYHYMRITVYLQCPPYDPAKDDGVARRGTVSISGVSTILYGQDSNQEVDREAYTQFGGHPYTFIYIGQSAQGTAITADVPLYLGVLEGLRLSGRQVIALDLQTTGDALVDGRGRLAAGGDVARHWDGWGNLLRRPRPACL